jgi:hypothetical protein
VNLTPRELRRQADHCRDLAESQFDARTRLILTTMASEFDQQARDAETPFLFRPNGADSVR